ncbi:ribosomal protein L7Ae [Cooperia oncophora]
MPPKQSPPSFGEHYEIYINISSKKIPQKNEQILRSLKQLPYVAALQPQHTLTSEDLDPYHTQFEQMSSEQQEVISIAINEAAPQRGDNTHLQQQGEQAGKVSMQKRVKKKKKQAPTKEVDLKEYVVDNKLRQMAGLKKMKLKTAGVSGNVHENSEEWVERKGIRKEKKMTPAKKVIYFYLCLMAECDGTLILQLILKNRANLEILGTEPVRLSFIPTRLDNMVMELLKKLRKQTDAARAKRSFVCGLHESLKHVRAENVKCVIVARNIDEEIFSGPSLFHTLRDECVAHEIPIVHASTKRLLSRVVQKFPYISIIALFYFQGFEELYCDIIQEWKESDSHIHYHADQRSLGESSGRADTSRQSMEESWSLHGIHCILLACHSPVEVATESTDFASTAESTVQMNRIHDHEDT